MNATRPVTLPEFRWFDNHEAFLQHEEPLRSTLQRTTRQISAQPSMEGWCVACHRATRFRIDTAAHLGDHPSLREGMVCQHCGLTSRNRTLYLALCRQYPDPAQPQIVLLERVSLLYRRLRRRFHNLHASEYLGPDCQPGHLYWLHRRPIRHQSVTALGHADASVDAIVHSDVLEHVYDYRRALDECRRVLRPGGVLLFTVPFFVDRERNLLRGRPRADGSNEHFEPPEYHGDGVRRKGIYTYHYYGWELLADMLQAGFGRAQVGWVHDPALGLVGDDHPPLILRGSVD